MKRDQLAPVDQLYREYGIDAFKGLNVDTETDKDFIAFVSRIRDKGPKFSIYTPEQLEKFAQKINELRKN